MSHWWIPARHQPVTRRTTASWVVTGDAWSFKTHTHTLIVAHWTNHQQPEHVFTSQIQTSFDLQLLEVLAFFCTSLITCAWRAVVWGFDRVHCLCVECDRTFIASKTFIIITEVIRAEGDVLIPATDTLFLATLFSLSFEHSERVHVMTPVVFIQSLRAHSSLCVLW